MTKDNEGTLMTHGQKISVGDSVFLSMIKATAGLLRDSMTLAVEFTAELGTQILGYTKIF